MSLKGIPTPSSFASTPPPLFPNQVKDKKAQSHVDKIKEIFSQVKINTPLLDAIQQMPLYARFLKYLCTTKRATNVPKRAFLTSNVSSIILNQVPLKCQNMGCPTISIVVGNHTIHRALLDLGDSVNLLSFTVYERLGPGELKSTKMVLQLTDCSSRLPRGMVEDVLIKLGKFIYPVDFVVLETKVVVSPKNKISVILGPSFLANYNALINCKDGKMKLTFGNMTMEVNVFDLQKQTMGFDDIEHSTLH